MQLPLGQWHPSNFPWFGWDGGFLRVHQRPGRFPGKLGRRCRDEIGSGRVPGGNPTSSKAACTSLQRGFGAVSFGSSFASHFHQRNETTMAALSSASTQSVSNKSGPFPSRGTLDEAELIRSWSVTQEMDPPLGFLDWHLPTGSTFVDHPAIPLESITSSLDSHREQRERDSHALVGFIGGPRRLSQGGRRRSTLKISVARFSRTNAILRSIVSRASHTRWMQISILRCTSSWIRSALESRERP
jgi:hypothetical protein